MDRAPAIVKCGSEAVFCSAQAVLSLRYRISCVSAQGQHDARDQEEPKQTHRCAQASAALAQASAALTGDAALDGHAAGGLVQVDDALSLIHI